MRSGADEIAPLLLIALLLIRQVTTSSQEEQFCGVDLHTLQPVEHFAALARAMTRKQFVLHGDSLTQQSFDLGGWGARLTSVYQRKADIKLRGYSGYNTRWALQTLDANFPLHGPRYDFATVWFGANDAALPNRKGGRQHVPLPEYKQNLEVIVDRLLALGAKVILITPPPVDDEARRKLDIEDGKDPDSAVPERTLEAAKSYAEAAQEVAEKKGVVSLDLWTKLQSKPDWHQLLSDGLHFNPSGNEAVFDALIELFNAEFPDLREDALLPDFPWHGAIGEHDFEKVFAEHQLKTNKI